MAISANAVWEIRTAGTASNVNGGFFVTGASGTDYSQQNAAQYNLTSLTSSGAGAVILTASAATDMVGNGIHITSGTNFTVGWYEITAASAGVSITTDRNSTTGVGAAGVGNIGGALSLGSSDDAVFENGVAGQIWYVKSGTYTLGGTVNTAANGSATNPIQVIGYGTSRGDNPVGASRPIFDAGVNAFTAGNNWDFYYMQFTGSAATMFTPGTADKLEYCKFTNTSTTANRTAVAGSTSVVLYRCELIAYRGVAFTGNSTVGQTLNTCYLHDSDIGISTAIATNASFFINNIIESNVTAAIKFTAAATGRTIIANNTLYGSEAKTGIGISISTGTTNLSVVNNIIYGFTTGISHADVQTVSHDDYNDINNCTTGRTNFAAGPNSVTTAPSFTNVTQSTGTAGTTASSILTDGAADFTNVVANQDFCYLISGTGITVGQYLITAKTTTTLTLSPAPGNNATADKVYQVTKGRNFAIGTNLKGIGLPGVFPAALTTGYMDIGAVQRQESASGGAFAHGGA